MFLLSLAFSLSAAASVEYRMINEGRCEDHGAALVATFAECEAALAVGISGDPPLPSHFDHVKFQDQTSTVEGCYAIPDALFLDYISFSPNGCCGFIADPDYPRYPICKFLVDDTYFKLDADKNCEGEGMQVVTTEEECETAAALLGLADTSASHSSSTNRPEGCYWFTLGAYPALWLAGSGTTGSTDGRSQICKCTTFDCVGVPDFSPTCWSGLSSFKPSTSCDPSDPDTAFCLAAPIKRSTTECPVYEPAPLEGDSLALCELGCCMGVCGGPCQGDESQAVSPAQNKCWAQMSYISEAASVTEMCNMMTIADDCDTSDPDVAECSCGPANALGWPAVEGQNDVFSQFKCSSGKGENGSCIA